MDTIKISLEEAARISDLLLAIQCAPGGGLAYDITQLRASLYKKIAQAQKKSSRRRSEAAELAALIKSNQEKIVR